MIIKVDNRETDLIPLIEIRLQAYPLDMNEKSPSTLSSSSVKPVKKNKNGCLVPLHIFEDIEVNNEVFPLESSKNIIETEENEKINKIKIEQLHIGDIVFEDDSGKPILIFERKTLNDLAASIKDGRYNEQSFRLDKEPLHNHNVIYIIEGDIERYNEKRTHISKKTLISSMFSLLYYKGFSVYRTNTIFETADTIVFFADKYKRTSINDKNRKPYYELIKNNDMIDPKIPQISEISEINEQKSPNKDDLEESEKYCGVIKSHKEKNEYITPENINIIMLSCVPGISSKTAIQLMSEYKTIQNLLYQLEKDPNCLNTFMLKMENGNIRKINKNCVDNIKKFLLNNNS
jgi:ERCC4-type nuclease